MTELTPPTLPEKESPPAGGVEFEGSGNVTVGGDVAGRDIVKNTTNVGLSAPAVQRLLLTVGTLVFITAACFFGSGLVVGGVGGLIMVALYRDVAVNQSLADTMQVKIDELVALPVGTPFQRTFTEAELNSYWELVVGPKLGLRPATGAARLLGDGRLLLAGNFSALANLKVLAVVEPRANTPGQLFKVDSAAIQLVPLGQSSLGWVPVPASAVQPFIDTVNNLFGARVELTGVSISGADLTVDGVGH